MSNSQNWLLTRAVWGCNFGASKKNRREMKKTPIWGYYKEKFCDIFAANLNFLKKI